MTSPLARKHRDLTAAEWAVRSREAPLVPADQTALDAWLAEHPANAEALEASGAVWGGLESLDLKALDAAATPARRPAVPAWAAMAASVALASVVGTAVLTDPLAPAYATGRGEVRVVKLADGSTVTLGAHSKIRVRYDARGRHVSLSDGEALFSVRHDPARPFEVSAYDTRVTVLGTQFTVKRTGGEGVRVAVLQGLVRVDKAPGLLATTTVRQTERLAPGERVSSPRGERLAPVTTVDPANIAPWTRGLLVYENASLAELADDVNRYGGVRVKLADADLSSMHVTAAFRPYQVGQFMETLPATLPVAVTRDGEVLTIAKK